MPELPEVETIRRSLVPCLGAEIALVKVHEPRLRRPVDEAALQAAAGCRISALERQGKYLILALSNEQILLLHFGMSGTLRLVPPDRAPEEHDHVEFFLADGRRCVVNDPRRFGLVWLGPREAASELAGLGPDALAAEFSPDYLRWASRRTARSIKNLLLDQRVVAGIGNIYANEALFVAGIRPSRSARRLTRAEIDRLHGALQVTLEEAIAAGGSSIADFHDSNGRPGYFQHRFRVYDRAGKPCGVCAAPVRRVVHTGRSSFYCPRCQH
ncbi:MAG: bifunctional DNA-formamidopyrimidine glycosylase/DNA-(apurinic or apyrimidinic site) lyase [Candidatus Binatia bacterium]|nr:bifunctional DNA-formamidopyrimidine glycosylase/DNA-(apurinic or apyrimidinic site) lyase [Candidatus Binatia bacterium]